MKNQFRFSKIVGVFFLFFFLSMAQNAFTQKFSTATQTQSNFAANQPYGQGTVNQQLLLVTVTPVTGTAETITQFDFSVTGSTEISKITICNTAASLAGPDINTLFGTTGTIAATSTVTGSYPLVGTTAQKFWVLVDLKPDATIGNPLDIVCTGVTVNSGVKVPGAISSDRNALVAASLSGIKTVKTTGGDYSTLSLALAAIQNSGIAPGGLEVVVDDDATFVQTSQSFVNQYQFISQPIGVNNPLIIRRSNTGTNKPIINYAGTSNSADCILGFLGSDYVTIDGLDFRNSNADGETNPLEYGILFRSANNDGCTNDVVKNCSINLKRGNNGAGFGIRFESVATTAAGLNTNNKIFNNSISNVATAIYLKGITGLESQSNEIYGNTITGYFGANALGAIAIDFCKDTKIYKNTLDGTGYSNNYNGPVCGMYTGTALGFLDVYNNVIKNVTNASTGNAACIIGMQVTGNTVHVYNNMISGLKSELSTKMNYDNCGIQLTTNTTLNPYFYVWNNSVVMNQVSPTTGITTTCLYVDGSNAVAGINLTNNVFVNTSTGKNNNIIQSQYIYRTKLDASTDNNLFYPEPVSPATNFVFLGANYPSLAGLKAGVLTNQHSIVALPSFVSASDLHINAGIVTKIEGGGKPVAQVTTDIDGDVRNVLAPDLGADEGNFIPLNLPPVMNGLTDMGPMYNNAGLQSVNLSGIDDANLSVNQNITFTCTSSNPALIPNPTVDYVTGSSTGLLKFTPAGSGRGVVTITVRLQDDGGITGGGIDTTLYTFKVTVLDPSINSKPNITAIPDLTIFNTSPLQTINLAGINDGEVNHTQTLTVTARSFPANIISQPTVIYTSNQSTGTLSFTPLAPGTTVVSVTIKDNGGHTGESLDSVVTTFTVTVNDFYKIAYNEKFDGTTTNWWVSAGQYSLKENGGNLKVTGMKNLKWVSFGCTLPSSIDITANPYMYLKIRTDNAQYPFTINAYISDGTNNQNIAERVFYSDSTYTELFFDFTGKTPINMAKITQILFAVNGGALTWNGTAWLDEVSVGANVIKAANICALPNIDCAQNATQQKVLLSGIENANSLTVSGGSTLIQNTSFTPISNKFSALTFDIKPGAIGKEKITVTANGTTGYASKPVTFWLNVQDNLPPTIDQQANINAQVGKMTQVDLSGISDGNASSVQNLTITAVADNLTAIPSVSVNYIQQMSKAVLKFNAASAAKDVKITVTVNDGQTANNIKTMTFNVNVFNSINNPPSLNLLDNLSITASGGKQTINLTGINDGDNYTQDIIITATSSVDSVVANNIPKIIYELGQTKASFDITPLKVGSTTITLTLKDNGGNVDNNGDQSKTVQFIVNVINDPVFGLIVPTETFTADLAKGVWAPQTGKFNMQSVTFDGFDNVLKVDMMNKSNWDGIYYNMKEVNVTKNPYMSMDVYPVTQDLYWHVYFYDINGDRNANGAHAQRKLLTKGQWNSIVLDYRPDGYLTAASGINMNTDRVNALLFNMHNPNFTFPFTNLSGSFYIKNIRVGDKTSFPNTVTKPTLNNVVDQGLLLSATTKEQTVKLSGISDGNFNTTGLTFTVSSSDPAVASPVIGNINADGTALLKYTPGTAVGTTRIILNLASSVAFCVDTFNIAIISNDPTTSTVLTVDTLTKYQKIRGFGTFQNSSRFIDTYTTDMGASAMRLGFISNQFEPVNDNNDPLVTDLSKFNRNVFDWNYLRAVRDRGVEDFVLTSWSPPSWMKGNLSLDYMSAGAETNCDNTDNKLEYRYYDEFAEMMVAFCKVFKEEMGIELTGIGLQNEPVFHEPYASAILDIPHFVQLIKVVGPRLVAEGLSTKIYMPEQVFSQGGNSMAAYIDGLQADPIANSYCTTIATHGYAADGVGAGIPDFTKWATMFNNCKEGAYPKELWMTETDAPAITFNDALYMANAIYGSLVAGNVSHWTTWSFQDTYFNMKANKPTMTFYASKNFFKFIRPGATRISSVTSTNPYVIGSSFLNNKAHGGNLVSVLINNGTVPYSIKLSGTNLPGQYDVYQTTEALNFEKVKSIIISDIVLLPARSVTTLVGSYGNLQPTIDAVKDVEIINSMPTNQNITLTGIDDGDLGSTQDITITAKSSNPALISNPTVDYIQGSSTATLNYTHIGSALGFSFITVTVKDNGGTALGAKDSVTSIFKVTVKPEVNLPPSINTVFDQSVKEDSTGLSIPLTGIDDGDILYQQPVTIDVTTDNPTLITSISVDYSSPNTTGVINYTIAPNLWGTATVTLTVNDHGGTTFNAGDMTKVITFKINVLQVNKCPTIDVLNNITINADPVENIIYLTGIGDGDLIDVQNVNVTTRNPTNRALLYSAFKLEYTLNSPTGLIRFTPSGQTGVSTVTLTVYDTGGTANGGVSTKVVTFDITFIPPTGLNDLNVPNVKLYPNPTKEYVHLNVPKNTYTGYTVYNMIGTAVLKGDINSFDNVMTINIGGLMKGLHLIKLTGSSQSYSLPFIVE